MSQLSAKDDFSKNLSFSWEYDSFADVEILLRIEDEFGVKISDGEAQNRTNTVEKIVDLVWKKVQEKDL